MENELSKELINVIVNIKQVLVKKNFSRPLVGEGQILICLIEKNGLTPGTLSDISELGSGRVANILKSMEEKGYIVRKKDDNDKRKVLVYITDEGKKWHEENKRRVEEEVDSVLKYIGEQDTKELIRILNKVVDYNNKKEGKTC